MFISLTSDFDLDAAFMSSSLPYLSLKVEPVVCSGNMGFHNYNTSLHSCDISVIVQRKKFQINLN